MMMGRVSGVSMSFVLLTFGCVYGVGYVGALVAIPIFIIAFIYFSSGVINFVSSIKG
jgi:hypothetical protein